MTETTYDAMSATVNETERGRRTVWTKPPMKMIGTSTMIVAYVPEKIASMTSSVPPTTASCRSVPFSW